MRIRNSKAADLTGLPITTSITNSSPDVIEVMNSTIDWLGRCGYDGIDYGCLGALGVSMEQMICWKHAAEEKGLAHNSMHFRSYGFDALDGGGNAKKFIEDGRRDIELAAIMNCSDIAFHIADCPDAGRDEFVAKNAELFANLVGDAEKAGVTVCLENHYPTRYGKNVGDLLDILSMMDAGDSFGLCLDTGHCVIAGLNPAEQILQAGKRLRSLHLHDNFGKKDTHLVPGLGVIDWFDVFKALDAVGYQGAMNMEIGGHHPHDTIESVAIAGMHCMLQLLSEFQNKGF